MRWQHCDTMCCYRLVDWWWCGCICVTFVKVCKRFTKHTHERQHYDAMCCARLVDGWCFCICKSLPAVYKTHAWDDNTVIRCVASSPRNPRFPIYRRCIQTTFHARMSIFKSGISGSGCVRLVDWWWCGCICKSLQAVYKTHAWETTLWCDVLRSVGWWMMLLYL
jgi:hypothetical protein